MRSTYVIQKDGCMVICMGSAFVYAYKVRIYARFTQDLGVLSSCLDENVFIIFSLDKKLKIWYNISVKIESQKETCRPKT